MTFFQSDLYGRQTGNPAGWTRPTLGDVVSTAGGNGYTLDAQAMATAAVVEVSPGVFDIALAGGVAQTDPMEGCVLVFIMRDRDNRPLTVAPRALIVDADIVSPPADSTGVRVVAGISTDDILTKHNWGGIDYDGVPRARCGQEGISTPSATAAGCNRFVWSPHQFPSASLAIECETLDGRAALMDATGIRTRHVRGGSVTTFAGPARMYLSLFGSGVLVGVTIRVSVKYYSEPIPAGVRF